MPTKNSKVCAKAQKKKNYHLDSKHQNPYFLKKKKQTQNNLQAHAGKYRVVILQRKRDSLSAVQGLWCLFPADFLGD